MLKNFSEQLDDILSEDVVAIEAHMRSTFDQLSVPFEKNLILFGAGALGRRTLVGLRKLGIEPLAFSDNNSQLWNSAVEGVQIISPSEAVKRFGEKAIFVLAVLNESGHPIHEIRKLLNTYGSARVISFAFLFLKYADTFLPFYCLDLPHEIFNQSENVRAASQLWADDASRAEYLAQLRWRLYLDFDGLPKPASHPPYFPTDLFSLGDETVFVDCGAFDGDTIHDFLKQQGSNFNKIFAFEPDRANFTKLDQYVATLPKSISEKIKLFDNAVGERREILHFDAVGSMQSVVSESGCTEVESVSLDEVITEAAPTYVKMDVEGTEPEALLGMQNIIKENAPILAISVYHKLDHLWQLPLLINSLSGNYKFFLRPHSAAVLNLICYAVPSKYFGAG